MKRLLAIISTVLAIATAASANDLQSGYFLKGYNYAYRLNPAFMPSHNFIGLPGIGNIGSGVYSNLGVNSVLLPHDGKLVTFLHPDIPAAEALSRFNKGDNKFLTDLNVNVLSLGFKTGRFYHTVDLNSRSFASASLPYGLFRFLKEEYSEDSQNIGNINFAASSYAELAYGISFNIAGLVRVGARVKGLAGLANTSLDLKNVNVILNEDRWAVKANGAMTMALDGIKSVTKEDGTLDIGKTLDNMEGPISPSGYGIALDLGVQVNIIPDFLKVSASITDIGGIGWSNKINATSTGTSWSYTGASDIPIADGGSTSIGDELSNAFDELTDIIALTPQDEVSSFEMLPTTIRAGGEVKFLPCMTAGLLAPVRTGTYGWSEVRASVNADYKVISGTVSAAYNSFGFALGAAANLNLRFVSLFVGADAIYLGKLSTDSIPIGKPNVNFVTGLNIQF